MNEQIYGGWESPITPELLAEGSTHIREVVTDGDLIWWSEQRPKEKGRIVICCRQPNGEILEVSPPDTSVDSRIHSYGGAGWWVQNGTLIFADQISGALYLMPAGSNHSLEPAALTPAGSSNQYGDGRLTPDGRYFICIRERKADPENINEIVAVPTNGSKKIAILAGGADFYSFPRISPDGSWLAWIQWSHPNMAWDGTELWASKIKGNKIRNSIKLKNPVKLAGGKDEWIFQPEWKGQSELAYVSDQNGWSALFFTDLKASNKTQINKTQIKLPQNSQLLNLEAEIALPPWSLGESRYCFLPNGDLAYASRASSRDTLIFSAAFSDDLTNTFSEYTSVSQVRPYKDGVAALAGSWESEEDIVYVKNTDSGLVGSTIVSTSKSSLDKGFFPAPEFLEFPAPEGEMAYGLYYAPANPELKPNGEEPKPPLIVMAHGGPTGEARTSLYLGHRFWTSRGFAILDVNYRGSTGFGRKYRQTLYGNWGKTDIEDCIAGAQYLIDGGRVNPEQIMIRGSSSGGLTVLLALALSDIFSCAAIRYGIVDLKSLEETTHKFESRYVERLIGSHIFGESIYEERSPINHIDRINTPMIIMSGTDDPVVPPAQSQQLAEALEARGVKHQLLMFEGEGHGFRQSENQIRAISAELDFTKEVFGLK